MRFSDDYVKGQKAVEAVKMYLMDMDNANISFRDATPEEQKDEIDLVVNDTETCEIKVQSKPNVIAVEETSQDAKPGWIYTSKAKWLLEVSDKHILKIDMQKLWEYYCATKHLNKLIINKGESDGWFGDKWHSSFRYYPVTEIANYVGITKVNL